MDITISVLYERQALIEFEMYQKKLNRKKIALQLVPEMSYLRVLITSLLFLILTTSSGLAEFYQLSPFAWTDGATYILSTHKVTGYNGIVVINYDQLVSPQKFPPSSSEIKPTEAISFEFDPNKNKFVSAEVGEHKYEINGNCNIILNEEIKIGLDQTTQPYLSISKNNIDPAKSSVLGILGKNVILNKEGANAYAMLSAGQNSKELGNLVQDYRFDKVKKVLMLGKDEVINKIGTSIVPKNPCLSSEAQVIIAAELTKLSKNPTRTELLKLKKSNLENSIPISHKKENNTWTTIAYNFISNSVEIITENLELSKKVGFPVCEYRRVTIGN